MKYQNKTFIWFDLGYTLLYLKRESLFKEVTAEMGITLSPEKIAEAFHTTDKLFMREYPQVLGTDKRTYMPWYFGHLLYILKIKLDLCILSDRWEKVMKNPLEVWYPFPETENTLKLLKEKGYRLGIISNWDKSARSILEKYHLKDFFDTIVISSEAGCEKPSAEIFTIALEEAGVSPEESLYVGDNYYDDAIGSRKAGIDVIILNPFENKGVEEINDCNLIHDISELGFFLSR